MFFAWHWSGGHLYLCASRNPLRGKVSSVLDMDLTTNSKMRNDIVLLLLAWSRLLRRLTHSAALRMCCRTVFCVRCMTAAASGENNSSVHCLVWQYSTFTPPAKKAAPPRFMPPSSDQFLLALPLDWAAFVSYFGAI
jgi:hypothetical protein